MVVPIVGGDEPSASGGLAADAPLDRVAVECAERVGSVALAGLGGADVDAALHLLTFPHPETGLPYLDHLLNAAREKVCKVKAVDSPFESKDALKERGYRWDAQRRCWWTEIPESEMTEESRWLEAEVYRGPDRSESDSVGLAERFRP